jgi:hypothetical protein
MASHLAIAPSFLIFSLHFSPYLSLSFHLLIPFSALLFSYASATLFLYSLFFFIKPCAYKAWVISPPAPTSSLTTHSTPPSSPHPLNTQQKLFCPYL